MTNGVVIVAQQPIEPFGTLCTIAPQSALVLNVTVLYERVQ